MVDPMTESNGHDAPSHDEPDVPNTVDDILASRSVSFQVITNSAQPGVFANHILASWDPPNFVVRFVQLLAPPARTPEEWEQIESTGLQAPVVATLVIPAERWAEAIDNIGDLVARLRATGRLPERKKKD
jgi:hypothetical protein